MTQHFPLDYSSLEQLSNKTYKLADVKHRLVRKGADLVAFRDAPENELWEVQTDGDGDYIVARYESEDDSAVIKEASVKSPWQAVVKEGQKEVSLFYKGNYFTRFSHDSAETVKNFLPVKLATDKTFLTSLISSLPEVRKAEVKKLYPELF